VAPLNIEKSDNSPSLQCLQARMKTTGRDVSFSAVRGRLKVDRRMAGRPKVEIRGSGSNVSKPSVFSRNPFPLLHFADCFPVDLQETWYTCPIEGGLMIFRTKLSRT